MILDNDRGDEIISPAALLPHLDDAALVRLAWAFALPAMGFLASSAIAFVLLLMLANHERWTMRTVLLYGATGVLVLGGLYALFKHALQVPLP